MLKLDSTGDFVWVERFTGTGQTSIQGDVVVDSSGNIHVTGLYAGMVDFDNSGG